MKARPILFSGPMVRALLEGRKTQTRRVVKPQPPHDCGPLEYGPYHPTLVARDGEAYPGDEVFGAFSDDGAWAKPCPYGRPGDLLWCRETWAEGWTYAGELPAVFYKSTMDGLSHCQRVLNYDRMLGASVPSEGMKWRPSIHMPRWASRLTLRITDVRVERLQDISDKDARAEGVNRIHHGDGAYYFSALRDEPHPKNWCYPTDAFREIWESLNGAGSWELDPWVWVVGFSVIRKNIDEVK